MNDSTATVVERILQILADGLPPAAAAVVVAVLSLLVVTVAILYMRRPAVPDLPSPRPLPSPPATTINVSVGNTSTRISNVTGNDRTPDPPVKSRPSARRCYAELQRIAALPADDDEEFNIF